jgi:hypothetical protein
MFPGLVPSDIEIRGNHITRPMSWKGIWLVKNLVELKVGRRVLIEGNVLENSWVHGQLGWAFVLWSVNQQGTCGWCVTEHVVVRNNLIRNVAAGFNLGPGNNFGADPFGTGSGTGFVPMNHVAITNNVIIGLDNPQVQGGGISFQVGGVSNLSIEHNTVFNPTATSPSESFLWVPGASPSQYLVVRNNLTGGGNYPLFTTSGQWSVVADASTSAFVGNVVVGAASFASGYPSGNMYPATFDVLGLGAGSAPYSLSTSLSSLALGSLSPFKGQATDGTDIGANIGQILGATANAIVP